MATQQETLYLLVGARDAGGNHGRHLFRIKTNVHTPRTMDPYFSRATAAFGPTHVQIRGRQIPRSFLFQRCTTTTITVHSAATAVFNGLLRTAHLLLNACTERGSRSGRTSRQRQCSPSSSSSRYRRPSSGGCAQQQNQKRKHRVSDKSQWQHYSWQHTWQHSWVLTRQCRFCFSVRWRTFVVLVLFSTFSCAMPVEHPSMLPPCFPLSTIEGQVLNKHKQRKDQISPNNKRTKEQTKTRGSVYLRSCSFEWSIPSRSCRISFCRTTTCVPTF